MPLLAEELRELNENEIAEDLADRAVTLVREGLAESSGVRKRVFQLMMKELKKEEVGTLVREVGVAGIRRLLLFLRTS